MYNFDHVPLAYYKENFLKKFSFIHKGIALAKEVKPLGAKATYVSNNLSNFKGFSKKQYYQPRLILILRILTQILSHTLDSLNHVFFL